MTRKEAIEQLKINRPYAYTELREAVDMAIEALQTEPCEDCISRQAVLDYIDKMPSELNQYGNRMIRRIRLTEYIADSLSSVHPEQKVGKWTHDGSKWENRWLCECGYKLFGEKTRFCPDCGAKMEEGE